MIKKIKILFPRFIFVCVLALSALCAQCQLTAGQIDSLARELKKAKEDTSKVLLLKELFNNTGYNDLNTALEYALQGFELSKKLRYDYGIGMMAYNAGFTYTDLGNFMKADSFLLIAEKNFLQTGNKSQLAKLANARGGQSYKQGDYWGAADNFSKASEGFDEIKDTANSLIAYQNLVSVLGEIKNYGKAITSGKKILLLAEARKDTLQIGYTLQSLCTNLIYLGKYDEALQYLQPLLIITNKTLDDNLAAEAYSTAGTYYFRIEDYGKAISYFERSVEKAGGLDDKYQLANHYNSLGQSFLKQGDLANAKKYLLKADTLAHAHNNKKAIYNTALSLSEYFAGTGDYKRSYENMKTHLELKDSILDAETRNYSSYLETKYESNKKENEILRLQKADQEKEFKLKRRTAYLAIGIGLITALVVILYLLKRNYGNKQKLSEQQSALLEVKIKTIEKEHQITSLQSMINGQETERTRIAKDLHDGIGGIFSAVKMHYSTLQQDTPEIKNNTLYKKTLDLINNASDELRKVAHNMMPEVLMKVGLVEALQDFCNNISSGKLLKMNLQTFGMEKRLNPSTEIMLYRIIQELVNNIIKHAYASEAIIQMNREDNRLVVVIEDNGKGFDTKEAGEKRSMGMNTIKSRVDYLNGRLTIDSRKDIGTTVMIDLLINE